MSLPKDKFLLLSYINTQLRDNFKDPEELCAVLDVDKTQLINDLKEIGYIYDEKLNAFK